MVHNAMLMRLQRDIPLAPMTTLGVGGPAKYFVHATGVDDIREAVEWAATNGEPLLVLAGGSNVVISDEGFNGIVLHVDLRGINVESEDRHSVVVNVAAGEPWDGFVAMAVRNGWAGVECLSGIPGTAGATPIQNVGAYGQEVRETIVRVETLDRATGRTRWMTNAECGFGYRTSVFKGASKGRAIVLSVTFRLTPGGAPAARYPELQRVAGQAVSLQQMRDAVIAIRRGKGMVIDPADPDTRSDGSFFMNPIVPPETLARLPDMPHFPAGDQVKLSAAWLIEHAGFQKGFTHGKAGTSSKHTLAIINRGGATAREVLELARMIQGRVHQKFGIELQPEPDFIGFGCSPDR